jgi:exodeoxyribonuclease V beta subunit
MTAVRVARPAALPAPGERFVVVEASAGTGKTFFLEHRVVDIILGSGADLGQILLVTFTEKAVAELRMRIRDLLDRLARATTDTAADGAACWTIDDAARTVLRAAVTAFDRAPIFTIHGFCHRVLVEDAFAARRLFDQAQVADEVAFDAAFGALLRERFARPGPERDLLAAYLESHHTVDDLRALLLGCARANATPRRTLDAAAARAVAEEVCALFAADRREALVAAIFKNGRDNSMVERIARIGTLVDRADLAALPPARCLGFVDELREHLAKIGDTRADRVPELKQLLGRVALSPTLPEAIAAELLPTVLARITADKAEHGQFDYDDMLELVREALAGPRGAEVAARLRERTPWVMIDEFQDTDPTQWKIFRDVWMHADARGLTIVGDPKQAIYGFRGADVHTYLAARDELKRVGACTVALDVNRRSTPRLVAAVNHVLVGTLANPLMTGDITYDAPVSASGDVTSDDICPPVTVFALQGSGRGPNLFALAEAIGAEIEALRAAPPLWERRGASKAFELSDVMILTRGHRESALIAGALRRRGLPCALVESDKLFRTREADELAAVFAAVAAPRDRSARLRALRTRFFDVPWADLPRVVDAPDHHPLIARLYDWAGLAARRAYETLFRRIVEDSRFAERALVVGGGERAITNTWHLIELLLGEVARTRSDLHELVVQLRRWIADGETDRFDDLDVQRAETDADAIRILTIHKAKGLEAPFVFVYGGASSPPNTSVHTLRDPSGRSLVVDPRDTATKDRISVAAEGENQRLAYVALTRAQVRLYLPRYGDKACSEHGMYWAIQRCLATADQAPGFRVVPVAVGAEEAEPAPPDALAGFVAPPAPALGELPVIDGVRGGLAMLSYTRLAHDVTANARTGAAPRGGSGAPLAIDAAEFDVDGDDAPAAASPAGELELHLAPNDLPPGPASGLLLHHVLEHADLDVARRAPDVGAWLAQPEVAALLGEAARLHGIEARHVPHAAQLAHATLTQPLAPADAAALPPLVAADALAREVEFTFPLPGAPVAGLVKGYIDAVVAWGDELWVLDYKSDLLAGGSAAAARARVHDRYGVQMRLYALAAARMAGTRRFAGMLFAFVRHAQVVAVRVDDAQLAEWTAWLAQLREPREVRA